jgi:tRNA A-37 threonylcarbamoyl transferase component Bud32
MDLNLKTETIVTDDSPAAQAPLPPEQIAPFFPQLEILELLGRGGMGVVYKARQKSLNRLVALKLLAPERVQDPKFAERFAREAQALAALSHPNIVTIHDFGQAGGFYYLLMEYVDGANLRDLLSARKLTPEEALAIVPPLCDALQFAHERGIVHRDIKPANLLLDKTGRIKVADFGIAKMLGGDGTAGISLPAGGGSGAIGTSRPSPNPSSSALTEGQSIGTPGYSAPEQMSDSGNVDNRADIYSLGVVFYEMLTGELPGKLIEPPSRKVRIDVRLDEVVLRALEQKPEQRYQQAGDMKTGVETILTTPLSRKTSMGPAGAMVKSERARLTVQEFEGAKTGYPTMGEVALHTDRLVVSSGYNQRTIPLADIQELGEAVMPIWFSPGPHRYAAVDFDEDGRRRRLFFLAGTSMFRMPGDTQRHAAEWLSAIQRAIKSATGRDTSIHNVPTVMPMNPLWSLIWLAVPLFAGLIFLPKFLLSGSHAMMSGTEAAWMLATLMMIPAVVLVVVFVARHLVLNSTKNRPLGGLSAVPPAMPGAAGAASGGFAAHTNGIITAPAVALMVAAGWKLLSALMGIAFFAGGGSWLNHIPGLESLFGSLGPLVIGSTVLFQLIPGLLIMFGGYQMLMKRSYAWAMAAAIISIISCSFIGFPIGIWALVVLARDDVKSSFGLATPGVAATAPGSGRSWRPTTVFGGCLALIVIVVLLFAALAVIFIIVTYPVKEEVARNNAQNAWNSAQNTILRRNGKGEFYIDSKQFLPLVEDGRFSIDNVNGKIEIHGWDSNVVVVSSYVHGRDAEKVKAVTSDIDSDAVHAFVHTKFPPEDHGFLRLWSHNAGNKSPTVDYVIQVPRHAILENITSVNGQILVDGVSSEITASTVNGETQIKGAAGSLKLSTVNGRINADMTALGKGQTVSLDAVNGHIELELPTNAQADVSVSTLNGGISTDFPSLKVEKEFPVGNKLSGSLGGGGGTVKVTTVNGAVNISQGKTGPQAINNGKSEPPDLREAKTKLAELKATYGENHPDVQSQQAIIKEFERMDKEEPNAPADLREAKAKLAGLKVTYGENHPDVVAAKARVDALEGKNAAGP